MLSFDNYNQAFNKVKMKSAGAALRPETSRFISSVKCLDGDVFACSFELTRTPASASDLDVEHK